jgi:hypothetical protein
MKKSKKVVIQVRNNDATITEVEVDDKFIEFYKKETSRSKATAKGLAKFLNHLINVHYHLI